MGTPIDFEQLTYRTSNILREWGVLDIEKLTSMSTRDLLDLPNMGKKSTMEVRQYLSSIGLTLKNSPTPPRAFNFRPISLRDKEVVIFIADGTTLKDTGKALGISGSRAKQIFANVMRRIRWYVCHNMSEKDREKYNPAISYGLKDIRANAELLKEVISHIDQHSYEPVKTSPRKTALELYAIVGEKDGEKLIVEQPLSFCDWRSINERAENLEKQGWSCSIARLRYVDV